MRVRLQGCTGVAIAAPAAIVAVVAVVMLAAPRAHAQPAAPGDAKPASPADEAAAAARTVAVIVRAPDDPPLAPARLASVFAGVVAGNTAVIADPVARARRRLERGAVAADRLAAFRRARSLAADGWRAYTAVEVARGAELLDRAAREAAQVLDLPGGFSLYADVALRRGVVLQHQGRDADARSAFALAAALDPDRTVSMAEFHPDAVAAYEAARAAAPAGTHPLRIAITPPEAAGATLEVDGARVTASPAEASADAAAGHVWDLALTAGMHVAVARAPGHHARGVVFEVPGAAADPDPASPAVSVALAPDPYAAALLGADAALPIGLPADRAARVLAGIAHYGETPSIVLAAPIWRFDGAALLGQRCEVTPGERHGAARAGAGEPAPLAVSCTRVVEIGFPRADDAAAAAASLWAAVEADPPRPGLAPSLLADPRVVRPAPRPAVADRQPDAGGEIDDGATWRDASRNPWLWVGVGVAVAATGAVWWLARGSTPEPVVTVDPCGFVVCPGRGQ